MPSETTTVDGDERGRREREETSIGEEEFGSARFLFEEWGGGRKKEGKTDSAPATHSKVESPTSASSSSSSSVCALYATLKRDLLLCSRGDLSPFILASFFVPFFVRRWNPPPPERARVRVMGFHRPHKQMTGKNRDSARDNNAFPSPKYRSRISRMWREGINPSCQHLTTNSQFLTNKYIKTYQKLFVNITSLQVSSYSLGVVKHESGCKHLSSAEKWGRRGKGKKRSSQSIQVPLGRRSGRRIIVSAPYKRRRRTFVVIAL